MKVADARQLVAVAVMFTIVRDPDMVHACEIVAAGLGWFGSVVGFTLLRMGFQG